MLNLKTERCLVRNLKPSDADGLFEVLSDADVMRHIEPPFTFEQTKSFITNYGLCKEPKVFALIKDKSKSVIGHVIFHPFCDVTIESQFGKGKVYELGFIIGKKFWRQGIATELTQEFINYTKASDISALVLECDKDNLATIRIAEKFNFKRQTSQNSDLLLYLLDLRQS